MCNFYRSLSYCSMTFIENAIYYRSSTDSCVKCCAADICCHFFFVYMPRAEEPVSACCLLEIIFLTYCLVYIRSVQYICTCLGCS